MKNQSIVALLFILSLVSCTGRIDIDSKIKPGKLEGVELTPKLLSSNIFNTTTNTSIGEQLVLENTTLVTVKTMPSNGIFNLYSDDSFLYTPSNNFNGEDFVELNLTNNKITIVKTIKFIVDGIVCPNNYVKIASDSHLNVNEFCVMKFEAKQDSLTAVSQSVGVPWTGLNIQEAREACQRNGANYDLISNKEWMSIASLIESNSLNWHSELIQESSFLNKGHTDGTPYAALSVSNEADPYDQTMNNEITNWAQRRTFYINSTDFLWDFSGNVWEFVNWDTDSTKVTSSPINNCLPVSDYISLNDLVTQCPNTPVSDLELIMPRNPYGLTQYDESQNIGNVYVANDVNQGYLIRGGYFDQARHMGIYATALDVDIVGISTNIGFRCVFRK